MSDRDQPRLNTVHDLFKYAIEHQSGMDANPESDSREGQALNPLDPERRRFLEEALTANTVDVTEELKKGMTTLDRFLTEYDQNDGTMNDENRDLVLDTIDMLLQWVGQVDFARDFFTLGGYPILVRLFDVRCESIQTAAFNLAAELLQNNPSTQATALSNGLLRLLIEKMENDAHPPSIRVKTIYCLSALLRGNDDAIEQFLTSDGVDVLVRVLLTRSNETRLCIKVSFLLHSLSSTHSQLLDTLLQRGLIDVFVDILQRPTCPAHEFLLQILLTGCETNAAFVTECRRPELRLRFVLRTIIDSCRGKEEHLEVETSAVALFQHCFDQHSPEGEECER